MHLRERTKLRAEKWRNATWTLKQHAKSAWSRWRDEVFGYSDFYFQMHSKDCCCHLKPFPQGSHLAAHCLFNICEATVKNGEDTDCVIGILVFHLSLSISPILPVAHSRSHFFASLSPPFVLGGEFHTWASRSDLFTDNTANSITLEMEIPSHKAVKEER